MNAAGFSIWTDRMPQILKHFWANDSTRSKYTGLQFPHWSHDALQPLQPGPIQQLGAHLLCSTVSSEGPISNLDFYIRCSHKNLNTRVKINSYCIILFSFILPVTVRKEATSQLASKLRKGGSGVGFVKVVEPSSFMTSARSRKCGENKNDINQASERKVFIMGIYWVIPTRARSCGQAFTKIISLNFNTGLRREIQETDVQWGQRSCS